VLYKTQTAVPSTTLPYFPVVAIMQELNLELDADFFSQLHGKFIVRDGLESGELEISLPEAYKLQFAMVVSVKPPKFVFPSYHLYT
jgi:hypothetical protein